MTSISPFIRRVVRQPLWLIALLWPVALLGPYVPGLPRPEPSGLPWRQEILIAVILSATLALLVRRVWSCKDFALSVDRRELLLWLPAVLFTLWAGASARWSVQTGSAIHAAFEWSAYLLFFALMRQIAASPRLLRASFFALGAVVLVLCASCMVGFWGAPTDTDVFTKTLFRFFSGFSEPIAMTIPLYAAIALSVRKLRWSILCGAVALLAWLATLQTVERAPIIGASAGLFLLIVCATLFRNCRPRSFKRAGLLFAVFVLATTFQMLPSHKIQGNTSAFARLQSTSAKEQNTRVRLLFWSIGLEMFRAHPFTGVGANNYEVAYAEARARFSAAHPDSPLVGMHEEQLVQHAHNEYVQVLAELGIVGFLLLASFGLGCALLFLRALRNSKRALLSVGAGASLLVFALSSGASSFSFRWMASGLIFFFSAAILTNAHARLSERKEVTFSFSPALVRAVPLCALALACAFFYNAGARAMNVIHHGTAQASATAREADEHYREAISWGPDDAATHFNYGVFLFYQKRMSEAVPHLRYGVARGLNVSACYGYLAAAQAAAGQKEEAEKTLADALKVYPRSIFLRVRHASALADLGRQAESEQEYATALSLNPVWARGWWNLTRNGIDAATEAAHKDLGNITMPGDLWPQNCLFVVLAENDLRMPPSQETKLEKILRANAR
ncbi:MAG: O-antigen ligase family protein [Pyrinomonadaceae bacterium]